MLPTHFARSSCLRRGRSSAAGGHYLVTTVTRGREKRFVGWEEGAEMSRAIAQPHLWRASRLLCWVLMPDHWHGLVELGENDALSTLIGRFKASSARRFNNRFGTTRSVWAAGYHDRAVRRERDVAAIARYVVMNPVRAGLVERAGAYPFWDAVWLDRGDSLLTPLLPSGSSDDIAPAPRAPNPFPSRPPPSAPT